MWMGLAVACVALAVLLYVPGYLLFRGMGLSRVLSVCCAPCASIAAYAGLSIVYGMVGIPCGLASVGAPALFVGTLVWLVGRRRKPVLDLGREAPLRLFGREVSFDLVVPACYVAVGLVVSACVFGVNLSRPDSIVCDYDNQTHLNAVQAFLDSGVWSSLHVGPYLAMPAQMVPVTNAMGEFYPAGWHDTVALVCLLAQVSVPVATNAMILVVCGVTYPLAAYLFVRAMLPGDRLAALLGALLPLSCAAVPWIFVAMGPTLPDMAGRLLTIAPLAVVVLLVRDGMAVRHKVLTCAFVACAFGGLALLHPNTVFAAYVFLVAFGAHLLWRSGMAGRRRAVLLAVYCIAVVALWVGIYQLPFLQSTLGYYRAEDQSALAMLRTIVTFGFNFGRLQVVLGVLAVLGVIALVRHGEWWLLFPVAFFCACFVFGGINCKAVSYWIGGLWYQSSIRFPPSIVVFLLPCLALGAATLGRAVWRAACSRTWGRVAAGGLLVALCVINYAPVSRYDVQADAGFESAFACVGRKMHQVLSDDVEQVYSAREMAFVDRAMQALPQGAYVFNAPNDGTVWAYAVNEAPVCYRDRATKRLTDDARLVSEHLCEYASDARVREAVERMGIHYVLLLDKGVSREEGTWLVQYTPAQEAAWRGIAGIDDNTPGFSVVLSEGDDMRLYRIG
ncbi:MAG: hypothetical protein Q4A01_04895 [Coriobacteriales bacterium]|nr:hypothetical protein [Coriobacteriales bacterium]